MIRRIASVPTGLRACGEAVRGRGRTIVRRSTRPSNGVRVASFDQRVSVRLSRFFGTTPQVWMNLQKTYELRVAEIESGKAITKKVKPWPKAANA